MFDIEYKGGNTVVIGTRNSTVIFNPRRSVFGAKDMSVKQAIEVATEARFAINSVDAMLSIEGPGEYEVGDFSIKGVAAIRHIDTDADGNRATIYRLEVGDTRIAVLGNISPTLSESQLEEIGVIDMLIIPVGGGGYTLDATSASSLVRQIEPTVVIPVHYADPDLSYEVPQDGLDEFIRELGVPVERSGLKLKVKSQSQSPSTLTIVVVDRS